jgi:3-hydroxybutyryl-CoA dehydrogenase
MFERIGVVGAGLMGSGIAEVSAKAGLDVLVSEVNDQLVAAGRARISKSLGRAVERGKITEEDRDAVLGRIRFTTELKEMADRDLVIEAATENEELKTKIFATLDEVAPPHTILASNTSSIPIVRLAAATNRPGLVAGMHFFNPVPVMNLVELTPSLLTDEATLAAIEDFAANPLGKTVIYAKDEAGFIVNRLMVPYLLSAIRLYESGFASKEDIDTGMVEGMRHPMGPLTLADFVGLDTTKFIADVLFEEFKDPAYAAPPLLVRMVEAGMYGRKSGRGFYDYT